MEFFPVLPETLNLLYQRGHITAEAFVLLAPVTWIVKNHPELLEKLEQAAKAIAQEQGDCEHCTHFSSVHRCCMTRIDDESISFSVNAETRACTDFDPLNLPNCLDLRGHHE